MSLGKLLNAGKSLVGLHNSAARYELRTGALPKFGSKKNPFAARPNSEEASMDPQPLSAAEMAAASLKDMQTLPLLTSKPEASGEALQPAQPATPDTASHPAPPESRTPDAAPLEASSVINGWLKKLNPRVWWEHRKPTEPKPAIPRFNKAPVQGELSLDNIKVMRNDLSDADVEIVPMKARGPKAATQVEPREMTGMAGVAAAAMAIPELPPAKNAWEFLGERLLGKQ